MEKILFYFLFSTLALTTILLPCKRELSCEGCNQNNQSGLAIAGPDVIITLPMDSVLLDGRGSSDPDGKISAW
jgi:hypothetical protein